MDRRGYAAMFAVALLSPVPSSIRGAGRQEQSPASQSTATPQSSDKQQSGAQKSGTEKDTNQAPAGSAQHSITVQFDYDFTKTPACTAKVTTACVQKFDVYDISGEKPYLLFSIPAPQNAQGMMKGISATSPRMWFAIGKHRIGVSAQMPNGEKSPPRDCKVIIEIKPDNPPNQPDAHKD